MPCHSWHGRAMAQQRVGLAVVALLLGIEGASGYWGPVGHQRHHSGPTMMARSQPEASRRYVCMLSHPQLPAYRPYW
jgi:hypothetical protein